MRHYLDVLPDAEFHALDTGHFALEDKGDEIAALMRDFLERVLWQGARQDRQGNRGPERRVECGRTRVTPARARGATVMTPSYLECPNKMVSAANGVDHAFREFGDGALPLVLLQQFRGNLDYWTPRRSTHSQYGGE